LPILNATLRSRQSERFAVRGSQVDAYVCNVARGVGVQTRTRSRTSVEAVALHSVTWFTKCPGAANRLPADVGTRGRWAV